MVPVTWAEGTFPIWSPLSGEMSGWEFPPGNRKLGGPGCVTCSFLRFTSNYIRPFITEGDTVDFEPGSVLPAHFTHWRFPIPESYTVSPSEHPNTLRLSPSKLNLTALDGNYAGPSGQTFVGRRQQDTLFTYSVNLDFSPTSIEEEAGVSVFLTQNHHLDLGVVMLPANSSTASFSGTNYSTTSSEVIPQLRFRGISYIPVIDDIIIPVPEPWSGKTLRLEIKASNMTHYSMSAGPADARSEAKAVVDVSNAPVSWGFTGEMRYTRLYLLAQC